MKSYSFSSERDPKALFSECSGLSKDSVRLYCGLHH